MNNEHFRGVVWPRIDKKTAEGKQLYRYVVIGMLVRDKPIEAFDGNEFLLDGNTFGGMGDVLDCLPQKKPTMTIGDANSVLTQLDILIED